MVEIVGSIDVAQVVLYVFWAFFAVLIFYLQQESRREGYPVESDETGYYDPDTFFYMPAKKTYKLPHGMGEVTVPDPNDRDTRPIAAQRANHWLGGALEPSGDKPLYDAIGPGSYAERADHPDLTAHGKPKIRPMRVISGFAIEERDIDPRGMPITTADGVQAGTVKDVWVDTAEILIRYLEIDLKEAGTVLLPMGFAALRPRKGDFYVHALMSHQIKDVPKTKDDTQITMLEEEKIVAFYGGGQLYADWKRAEPII